MAFIEEWTFDIKDGQFGAYQEWLSENEAELAASMPDGMEYLGTYACIFGDDSKGFARTLLWLEDYGSMDAGVASMRSGGRYAELLREAVAFTDTSNTARNSHQLWKEVSDTVYNAE